MSDFWFPCKRKKLLKALRKLGLALTEGGNHSRAECVNNGRKTTIPRHGNIKREIVDSICNFLIEKEFDKKRILELLK